MSQKEPFTSAHNGRRDSDLIEKLYPGNTLISLPIGAITIEEAWCGLKFVFCAVYSLNKERDELGR